jgi:hypothetical protein
MLISTRGLGMALLLRHARMRPVQIPVCPEPPLVFSHELLGGSRTGLLVIFFYEFHVYCFMWSEALSEYGEVPNNLFLYLCWSLPVVAERAKASSKAPRGSLTCQQG